MCHLFTALGRRGECHKSMGTSDFRSVTKQPGASRLAEGLSMCPQASAFRPGHPLRFAAHSQPMPLPCPSGQLLALLVTTSPLLPSHLASPGLLVPLRLTVLNSVDVAPCCADTGRKSLVDLSSNSIAKRSRKRSRRDSASALPACVDGLAMWKGGLLQMR